MSKQATIDAAPELLEALNGICGLIITLGNLYPTAEMGRVATFIKRSKAYEDAMAAIAKAEVP